MNGERHGGGLHLLTLGLFLPLLVAVATQPLRAQGFQVGTLASWLFVSSLFYIGVFLALLLFGFYTALDAKPVMGKLRIAD